MAIRRKTPIWVFYQIANEWLNEINFYKINPAE